MDNPRDDQIFEVFSIGSRVRCENEMWPGHWEYGTIISHQIGNSNYGGNGVTIRLDDGSLVSFDYRYLDAEDQRNSLVRVIKP